MFTVICLLLPLLFIKHFTHACHCAKQSLLTISFCLSKAQVVVRRYYYPFIQIKLGLGINGPFAIWLTLNVRMLELKETLEVIYFFEKLRC